MRFITFLSTALATLVAVNAMSVDTQIGILRYASHRDGVSNGMGKGTGQELKTNVNVKSELNDNRRSRVTGEMNLGRHGLNVDAIVTSLFQTLSNMKNLLKTLGKDPVGGAPSLVQSFEDLVAGHLKPVVAVVSSLAGSNQSLLNRRYNNSHSYLVCCRFQSLTGGPEVNEFYIHRC
ncbi:hypothetical protein B0H19DRAFT_1259801 [Mycena capillaripes]|nr:hypothetical protein B0H19DRAFT_1259801 [Mycena capillaripes]